ncbi:MAG: N-acetylmuramoyl-L-alanine amidase, partial [bacterium]|nr:N-acetylmuramoyl-L-alanine amidase [bacterium]
YYTYADYTRVVLDLSSPLKIKEKMLPGEGNGESKDRIYFDLERCDFAPGYPEEKKKEITVKEGHLQRIRIAKKGKYLVRVVFDFDKIEKYTRFYLSSPFRVVFDIFQEEGSGEPGTVSKPAQPVGKDYSIVRQLGLGVRTIVIDPGHGGKDPGTSNKTLGLYEKEIVLDIAKRLKTLLQKHPQYKVILTRDRDRYMSLEERTAIANSKKGDLFVSIHLNSAPRKSARGIESYYLSMTTDPWGMQVAALENKTNGKSIGEMAPIVELIVKNAQVSESRVFTRYIQASLVKRLKRKYKNVRNLGVKKAPFFVLAGARMPAVLVETSFLSNYKEGKRLKSSAYRYAIAAGLYNGIIVYIKSLGKK